MRALMARHRAVVSEVLVVDGYLGDLIHEAVGSVRFLVKFTTKGGHSWGNFGAPSAVHVLGAAIGDIAKLDPPAAPRTTFNVGVARGGTGVNVIAESAEMEVDVRSIDQSSLDDLAAAIEGIVNRRSTEGGAAFEWIVIGNRPAGRLSPASHLLQQAEATLRHLGVARRETAASTNANIPLSLGVPAVAMGAAHGDGVHTLHEYLEVSSLSTGIKQVLIMIGSMAASVAQSNE
jgi:acetylornithine deacetylase/succinyl-diaminopimelate desuccinylase-like protein